jgi:hypothetical protein
MNEADTCRNYVVPMLQTAGWEHAPFSIAEQRCFPTPEKLWTRLSGALPLPTPAVERVLAPCYHDAERRRATTGKSPSTAPSMPLCAARTASVARTRSAFRRLAKQSGLRPVQFGARAPNRRGAVVRHSRNGMKTQAESDLTSSRAPVSSIQVAPIFVGSVFRGLHDTGRGASVTPGPVTFFPADWAADRKNRPPRR